MASRKSLLMALLLVLASASAMNHLPSLSNGSFPYTPHSNKLHPSPNKEGTRLKRSVSSPFEQDEKCKISYQEMTSVADLLKMHANGQATADVPFSAATSGLNECQKAMQDIRTTAHYLITLSNKVKSAGSSTSADEYEKLKYALEETTSSLRQQLNHVKQQATQETQLKIKEIEIGKHALDTANKYLIQQLHEAIDKHKNDTLSLISLITSEIQTGDISTAILNFFELEDNRLIGQVITKAFDVEKVPNILLFIKKLPWLIVRSVAYGVLVDQMIANHHGSSPMGLNILADLEDLYSLFFSLYLLGREQEPHVLAESKKVLEEAKDKLLDIKDTVLGVWAEQIYSQSFEQIVEFEKNYPEVFKKYAKEVVERTYQANDDVIMKILALSKQLPNIEPSSNVYIELYSKMNATQQINYTPVIHMAHKINQLKNCSNYKNTSDNVKNKMQNLWDSFPSEIRLIVSGDSVCVSNDGFRSYAYLYVKDHHDNDRDTVYSTEKTDTTKISLKWRFEAEESDDKLFFRIKSDPYDDYLYSAGDQFGWDAQRRRLFTWRSGDQVYKGIWEVEDFDWRSGKFYLRNTHYNEYLSSSTHTDSYFAWDSWESLLPVSRSNGRRLVYTKRGGGRDEHPVWKIKSSC